MSSSEQSQLDMHDSLITGMYAGEFKSSLLNPNRSQYLPSPMDSSNTDGYASGQQVSESSSDKQSKPPHLPILNPFDGFGLEVNTSSQMTPSSIVQTQASADPSTSTFVSPSLAFSSLSIASTPHSGHSLLPRFPQSPPMTPAAQLELNGQANQNEAQGTTGAAGKKPRRYTLSSAESKAKPFKCPYPNCPAAFPRMYNLKSHILCHTGDKPHVCPHNCGAAFARKHDLQRHLRTLHSPDRPFPCPFHPCTQSYLRASAFWRHLVEDHEDRQDEHATVYHAAVQKHQQKLKEDKEAGTQQAITDAPTTAGFSPDGLKENSLPLTDVSFQQSGGKRIKRSPAITLALPLKEHQQQINTPILSFKANESPRTSPYPVPLPLSSSFPNVGAESPSLQAIPGQQSIFMNSPLRPSPATPVTPFIDLAGNPASAVGPFSLSSSFPTGNGLAGYGQHSVGSIYDTQMDFHNHYNMLLNASPQGGELHMTHLTNTAMQSPYIEAGNYSGSPPSTQHSEMASWSTWFGSSANIINKESQFLSPSMSAESGQLRRRSLSHSGVLTFTENNSRDIFQPMTTPLETPVQETVGPSSSLQWPVSYDTRSPISATPDFMDINFPQQLPDFYPNQSPSHSYQFQQLQNQQTLTPGAPVFALDEDQPLFDPFYQQ